MTDEAQRIEELEAALATLMNHSEAQQTILRWWNAVRPELERPPSTKCPPCPTCADLRADIERLNAGLRSQAIAGTQHWFYAPCPKCGAIEGMGMSSQRSRTVAVYCPTCQHFGPTIEGLSKESDRAAVIAWNREFAAAFAERDSLRKRVEALVDALRPFGRASDSYRRGAGSYAEPSDIIRVTLANGDRAAALLAEHDKEQGKVKE